MLLADTICDVVSPCGTSPARRTADSSTTDLLRSRNSSLPRGCLSVQALIAAGLVDRLLLIVHPSLAGGSGEGTYPRGGAVRPLSLHAGSVTAEGAALLDYRVG